VDSLSHHVSSPAPAAFVLAAPQETNSFDVWGVLSRRKWLVFLGLITGLALGGLFNAQCETVFRSEAKVKIEPRKSTVMQITNTNPVAPLTEDFEMRHDRLIGEHNIVRKCLHENNLMDTMKSFNDMPMDDVIEYVKANLYARPDREEKSLYTLRFYCRDANEVSTILNHLIDTYKAELSDEYSNEADRYKELLKSVDEKFTNHFMKLQAELREWQTKYDVPMVSASTNIHEHALVELRKQIEEDQKKVNEWEDLKNSTIKAIEAGPDAARAHYYILVQSKYLTDYSYETRDGNQSFLEIEIQKLMAEQSALEGRLGPGHPDVKNMVNRINRLQKWKQETSAVSPLAVVDPTVTLNQFLLMAQQTIEMNQDALARAHQMYANHYQKAQELTQVQRQIEAVKEEIKRVDVYVRSIQQKVIEADPSMRVGNTGRDEGFNFRIIMPASRGKQSWPILPLILSIGGLLGLLGGFALGCLVELADKTFHNPDEIVKQLNVPLIGHIPVIGQSKRYLVENSLIEPVVCSFHRPKSQVSEAFRAVRTSLFFNTQGKQHSVIQVTSPTPGDGKSTLAANLAVSIAQSGKRVLLVDADMRRPRQSTMFGITSKTGFATVLTGESDWHDVLYDSPEIEGLTVMPCGTKPHNPAELSSSPQVKELIAELRQEFDFVIIDTPPLLAVTDACPIAARVDGVILCIRIKKNVRVSAERATEMLANLGANCIGLVVNGVGAQSGYGSQYTYGAYRAGYSYNGYGYGYGYGYGAGKYYEDDKPSTNGQNTAKVPRRIEDQRMEKTSG
jgi:capsular exopolysaccharide synthesis family protein